MTWKKLLSAKRSKQLVGEAYTPSKPGSDVRTEIERDYGRAVFATAVRRLQDKAQVFPLEPNDFVRTRLTHSLEVSTLSRSLAKQVGAWLMGREQLTVDEASALETIAATCGLLHDIGNPPFGHAGEDAMREWFERTLADDTALSGRLGGLDSQRCSDFRHFEGNAQTLRLVTRLQVLADRHGLNLTCATLSAACKYVARSHQTSSTDHQRSKPGFFASEETLVSLLQEETQTRDKRNPITYLVEAADDMTYTVVDLEDAVRKGIISWDLLREEVTALEAPLNALFDRCEKYLTDNRSPLSGRSRDEALVQLFRTFAMYDHVPAAANEFQHAYDDILAGSYKTELLRAAESAPLLEACRAVARRHVYPSQTVVRLEVMGRNTIHRLMTALWEGVREAPQSDVKWLRKFPGKVYSLISDNYRRGFEEDVQSAKAGDLPVEYRRLQLVADYVAGMTDTFALSVAANLGLGV